MAVAEAEPEAEAPATKKRTRARAPRKKAAQPAASAEGGCGRRGAGARAETRAKPTASQEESGMRATRRAATLPVSFFERPAEVVARELVGTLLRSTLGGAPTAGLIVETEAYLGRDDPASHGYQDRRHAQNQALFGPPGTWYVYLSYGVHWCANLVCGPSGHASAVLLRALEPVSGLEIMRRAAGRGLGPPALLGTGKAVSGARDHARPGRAAMRRSGLTVSAPAGDAPPLVATPRIGITKAAEWPLRFVLDGSPWVSRGPMHRGV